MFQEHNTCHFEHLKLKDLKYFNSIWLELLHKGTNAFHHRIMHCIVKPYHFYPLVLVFMTSLFRLDKSTTPNQNAGKEVVTPDLRPLDAGLRYNSVGDFKKAFISCISDSHECETLHSYRH